MGRTALAAFIVVMVPAAAGAVDYPTRKAGLWELTMSLVAGQTMTMSQCTDAATDKDLITNSGASGQQACTKTELQKTATGYANDATCKIGAMTSTSHAEISGDFNSAYTVHITGHNAGGPAMMPADTDMTMQAKWVGPCKADQTPGDMIMPGGIKMNVKDLQKLRDKMPK